jgi:hypothetical protein
MARRGAKKVVLVIVEGESDRTALEGSLRHIYRSSEVRFKVVTGDITSNRGTHANNIKMKLGMLIKKEMVKFSLEKEDILEVIHIVDMDGAYIDESAITVVEDCKGFIYHETEIKAGDKKLVLERNRRKAENLDLLSSIDKINRSLKYSLYYFSCNQEHVLHNKINVPNNKKMDLAEKFNDKYENDFNGFKKFIQSEEFAVEGEYDETWAFIKKDNNSLKRFSNFHLLLKENQN